MVTVAAGGDLYAHRQPVLAQPERDLGDRHLRQVEDRRRGKQPRPPVRAAVTRRGPREGRATVVTVRPAHDTSLGSPSPAGSPDIARSSGIRSSPRRASGPTPSIRPESPVVGGHMPSFETTPADGLWPNTPQKSAGIRIEPAMSDAIPKGEPPEPTAAPSPPDEPPAVRLGSYGLLVRPYRRLVDSIHSVSSEVLVTPSGIA